MKKELEEFSFFLEYTWWTSKKKIGILRRSYELRALVSSRIEISCLIIKLYITAE